MFERHGTKIATFGAYLDRPMEFKGTLFAGIWRGLWTLMSVLAGTAGNQVLEWVDLDGDIKTAGLKNVSGGACLSWQCPLTDPHRILLLLRTCTPHVDYRIGSANSNLRLVDGNMSHNWRAGRSYRNSINLGPE